MKISEISEMTVLSFLREEAPSEEPYLISSIMAAALGYIKSYTGIPAEAADGGETLDDYEDLSIAFLMLCQDMYDNRTMMPDTKYANSANKTIDTILNMHVRNLL